jgi:pilus assembly protein CpaB
MRGLVVVVIGIALAIAGVTFVVVPRLLHAPSGEQPVAAPQAPAVKVLVAAANLPAGTLVKPDQIRWQSWPEQALDPSFIVEGRGEDPTKTVIAAAVKRGFVAGEPIVAARLAKKGEAGFLAAALTPGMRAVTVKIDAVTGLGGFVLPGDRVDVMMNAQLEIEHPERAANKNETKYFAEIVETDVRVLAVDQNMKDLPADDKTQAKVGATATLEVSVKQAERISVANQIGRLTLVLTSLARPDGMDRTAEASGWTDDLQVSRYMKALRGLADPPRKGGSPMPGAHPSMVVYRGTQGTAVGGER